MTARFATLRFAACAALALFAGPAFAQTAGFTDGGGADAFAPLSLIPDALPSAAPVRGSGAFEKVLPADPATAAEQPVAAKKARKLPVEDAAVVAEAPVEAAAADEFSRVPMPPRRPFDLRPAGKKNKVLLAKLDVPAIVEPAKAEAAKADVGSLTRSLTAIQKIPQPVIAEEEPRKQFKQLAALPGVNDVMQDVIPDRSYLIPEGGAFGGIIKQTPHVQIGCLRPNLIAILKKAGKRFGSTVIVTSGLRAGGRRGSYHKKCMAADVIIKGVPKNTLAAYFRSLPEAGGVGTYCHNNVVHIDTAGPRNWSYCGFRRTSFSMRGGASAGQTLSRIGQSASDDGDDE